jgi:methylated-DNA-[protein]-cysteine S-methyltransferase
MLYTDTVDTPLGAMTASAEEEALTGLWFKEQKYYPSTAGWTEEPDYPPFRALRAWLDRYFSGEAPPPWKDNHLLARDMGGTSP